MDKAPMTENSKEGVYVRLRGEVEPGPHVPAWGAHTTGVLRVQTVHCVLLFTIGLLPVNSDTPGVLDVP